MSKRVLITGGNSGIGYCTAEQLVSHGAEVSLACRDQTKGQAAIARIKNRHPDAKVRLFPWIFPTWKMCATTQPSSTGSWVNWTF